MIIILLATMAHCSKVEEVYNVPGEIQPLVESFEAESQKHGNPVFITNLIIEYRSDLGLSVRGLSWSDSGQNHIAIDSNYPCWNGSQISEDARDTFRELLLFHELGHLFLHRSHKEGIRRPVKNKSKTAVKPEKKNSIMASDINCPPSETFYNLHDVQDSSLREAYMAELFRQRDIPED